ncbi:PTS transporter subunit IIC [Rhodoferax sp. PAMC 29310]|uniref:PTS transporter subunit IIC n=1 Tax=Rhodoferax sp. PAMC 29310 TaxID=2822760 RepID=UPI001B322304|nr:PTS transporter subunit IIC [Rhodoferax sp. PAMC 29310]
MDSFQHLLTVFFSFKAYVMLPIIIFLIALAARVPLQRALFSTVALAAGFAGVFIAFDFFVANISPAVRQLSLARGLSFPVLDVGWPPLAAITWASPLAAISIPLVLLTNLVLLAVGWTRTIYIDIWNYWHFAFMGVLVMSTSGSLWLGLSATLVLAIYCFKMTEWTAPDVERETGLKGISASPISVNGLVPYVAGVDWLLDRIPGIKAINYNPAQKKQAVSDAEDQLTALDMLSEPMVIGVLMGLALALAADYGLKESLELSVHIAAVMYLLPKSAGLIGEAMMPITTALREQVERHFPSRKNLVVAMDTGFLMHHKSVVVTGLLLMALAIGIALVLPGNRVLPLGDLPNVISVMSLSVLMMRGNVFRAVLAGIPVIITFLWVASSMAPAYTELAHRAPAFNVEGLGLITAFTDGGHQLRYWLYSLYRAQWWAIGVLPLIGAGIFFTRRRFIAMVK